VADLKRTGLSQLREAYVAAVMAGLNVAAAGDSFDTFDRQLRLNQVRFDKGAISGLDLSRILQAQLEAQQVLEQARAGQAQAIASLAFLLGARSGAPNLTLTTGIDFRAFKQLEGATATALLELALKNRTDVKIAEQTLEQKEVVLRQARRAVLPDIQLQIGYSEQCNSATCSSAPTISAGLQGNLPILAQQQGQIKRALSDVAGARRALDKARAQVLSDVTQGHAAYSATQSLVTRMEGQLLAQAKRSRDLAQLMYQKGGASLIDFLDAQRTYLATVVEHNQDLAAYWASVYQLEQATATPQR
jgi:cobalt-zinc-cadmium efflux system outer membrane protein